MRPTRFLLISPARIWLKGKSRTVSLQDLGKGKEKGPALENIQLLAPKKDNMINYIDSIMQKHPTAVVLTQVGSFYEMYFEHAVEYSPHLNIRLAHKKQVNHRDGGTTVPMAGFPCHQLERYARVLLQDLRKSVVLLNQDAEQVVSSGSEDSKRPIERIFTPGTLLAESFLSTDKPNNLVAIKFTEDAFKSAQAPPDSMPVGLAWVDLTVGKMLYQQSTLGECTSDLARIEPSEILIDANLSSRPGFLATMEQVELKRYSQSQRKFPTGDANNQFFEMFENEEQARLATDQMDPRCRSATSAILDYIKETLPRSDMHLQIPQLYLPDTSVGMDIRSREALELFETSMGRSQVGSLFSVVRRTITASGTRLLREWMACPSNQISVIEERQNLVEKLRGTPELLQALRKTLNGMPDGKRVLQRLSLRQFDPIELVRYTQAIGVANSVYETIERSQVPEFAQLSGAMSLVLDKVTLAARKIKRDLDFDAILRVKLEESEEKNSQGPSMPNVNVYTPVVRKNVSAKLRELYDSQESLGERAGLILKKLEAEFENKAKVTAKWTPRNRHQIHVKALGGLRIEDIVKGKRILSMSTTSATIIDDEWASIGNESDFFYTKLQTEEKRIISLLRSRVFNVVKEARTLFDLVDEVDALQSLSQLALEGNLVKPVIVQEPILEICGGRHLSVEMGNMLTQNKMFQSNDCELSLEKPVCMVTGPNMGGKSTYIRQNAIICLLASMGSFVPAKHAIVGIVDSIFCRVGSGDDLFRGRSTFLMEMLETSWILHRATNRSLAILDEVGRGTSASDGLAIAYATIKHLLDSNKCRALFATHYGRELGQALQKDGINRVQALMASIRVEQGCNPVIDHKLRPGICGDSKGVEIARLANFPASALENAAKFKSKLI